MADQAEERIQVGISSRNTKPHPIHSCKVESHLEKPSSTLTSIVSHRAREPNAFLTRGILFSFQSTLFTENLHISREGSFMHLRLPDYLDFLNWKRIFNGFNYSHSAPPPLTYHFQKRLLFRQMNAS